MDAWAILKEIREGWPAVRAARWIIFLGVILGAVIGFGVCNLWWSGTVGTLRERLSFAQDKLQIVLAAPANPAALITKEPGRQLTDKDRSCIVEKFKDELTNFKAVIISAFPDDEAQRYANQFFMLFVRMGYRSGITQGSPISYGDVGVMVGFKDKSNPSDIAKRFKELLSSCNILNHEPIEYRAAPNLLPDIASVDFDLFIGPRE